MEESQAKRDREITLKRRGRCLIDLECERMKIETIFGFWRCGFLGAIHVVGEGNSVAILYLHTCTVSIVPLNQILADADV